MQEKEFKSTLAEVVKLLEPLSENEKRQAFALLTEKAGVMTRRLSL